MLYHFFFIKPVVNLFAVFMKLPIVLIDLLILTLTNYYFSYF